MTLDQFITEVKEIREFTEEHSNGHLGSSEYLEWAEIVINYVSNAIKFPLYISPEQIHNSFSWEAKELAKTVNYSLYSRHISEQGFNELLTNLNTAVGELLSTINKIVPDNASNKEVLLFANTTSESILLNASKQLRDDIESIKELLPIENKLGFAKTIRAPGFPFDDIPRYGNGLTIYQVPLGRIFRVKDEFYDNHDFGSKSVELDLEIDYSTLNKDKVHFTGHHADGELYEYVVFYYYNDYSGDVKWLRNYKRINFDLIKEHLINKELPLRDWLYASDAYTVYPKVPPSETPSHVLRVEATTGCLHNACTYCMDFRNVKYEQRTMEEFEKHIEWIKQFGSKGFNRVFLAGADAMSLPSETLEEMAKRVNKLFPWNSQPRRIALYGRTKSILDKSLTELVELTKSNLDTIYWGVESGSDEVLTYVNKGCTRDETIKASDLLNEAGFDVSVMIMPGLGGIKYNESHTKDTLTLLNIIRPKWITFLTINPQECSPYQRIMDKDQDNRPLSRDELIEQMNYWKHGLNDFKCKVAAYSSDITPLAANPITFKLNL